MTLRGSNPVFIETLRPVLETALDAVVVMAEDGTIAAWNAAAEATFGWSAEDAVGRCMAELIVPAQHREAHLAGLRRYIETGVERVLGRRIEISSLTRDGREIPVELSITAASHGSERMFVGFLRDISDRREAEAALRESAEELQAVLDAAPAAIWIARDPEAREIVGNRTSYELLRLDPGVNASLSSEAARPEGFKVWRDGRELGPDELPVQLAAQGQRIENFEEEVRFEDGTSIDLYGNATPLLDSDGTVRGAVAAFVDVTEAKRTQASLRESESRFRLIADSAPVPMWVTRLDRRREFVNQAYVEFLLVSREEAADFDWRTIIHPDDHDRIVAESVAGEASLRPFTLEGRYRRGDGAWRWLRSISQPRWDAEGTLTGFIGVAYDLTDEKNAQAALADASERAAKESSERSAILGQLTEGVIVTDAWGKIIFVNEAAKALHGVEALDVEPSDYSDTYHLFREDGSPFPFEELPLARAVMAGETIVDARWRIKRPEGSEVLAIGSARPIRDRDGAQIGSVLTVRDDTERFTAELALRESEAQFRAMADNISQFAWMANPDGWIIWYNQRWYDYTGTDLEAMQGWGWTKVHHPDHVDRIVQSFGECVRDGVPWEDVFPLRSKDGEYRWFLSRALPIRDESGVIVRWFGTNTDITDQRAAEQALRDLNENLERHVVARTADLVQAQEALRQSQKLEAMGQLTGGVAHDFNNLLTPIIGSLDLLQRRGIGSDREQRLIAGALQSADRAKTLVQRLLAFARRQPLRPSAVDVGTLVTGMAELIASTSGPQVKVVVDVPDALPAATADANQLEMAILNLSVNARDAMPDGGTLTIAAAAEAVAAGHRAKLRPGDYVRLSVADTGIGMDEATLAHAIEPFFSTKGIGKGTGLGLSMVHGLASQLGGSLAISSRPGLGTNVELWLPVSDSPVRESESFSGEVAEAKGQGTALLVDDEELVRMSTADMLSELGYRVVEASSGPDALRLLDTGCRPDVLVTDHLMPGMTGADLARTAQERRPDLPVLIVSGYAEAEEVAPHLPRLTKPFRQTDLAACMAELMSGRTTRPS